MNIHVFFRLFVCATCLLQEGSCVSSWLPWNWGKSKPKPVDGGWSSWTPWSSCQIPLDKDTLPFRFKERNCSNPVPKYGGATCKGFAKRTSSCKDCTLPLGLESGAIQDSFLSASDSHEYFPPSLARLNGKSSWCSDNPDNMQEPYLYLQIELKALSIITAIATQGFYPPAESLSLRVGRVSKYQLMYSVDDVTWEVYTNDNNQTVLLGNSKRDGTVKNELSPPITTRFLRVFPLSYFSFICMKVELYGCSFKCGGALTQTPGDIITESLPAEDRDCLWLIQLPNKTKLYFDFINFNVPCNSGHVELRNGALPYANAPLLAQYCGYDYAPPGVSSNSGKLWLRFKSNATDSQVGFYSVYFPGCGGHLQGSSGEIKSPNFPNEYFHNSKCIWTVTVPVGKSVQLEFLQFKIEGDSNRQRCPHDFLAIWNGSDTNAPLFGRFCNSNPPPTLICSPGSSIRLKFRSDDALAWTGFHILYHAVEPLASCTKMLSSSMIMLSSSTSWVYTSLYVTPTPVMTTDIQVKATTQTRFSTGQGPVVLSKSLEELDEPTVFTAASGLATQQSYVVRASNATGFTGMSVDAVQVVRNDDDDLTTIVIISVFSFIVICMILASVTPSIKHHCEKQRTVKEKNMILEVGSSIPEGNSKETFDHIVHPGDATCEPVLYKQSLLDEIKPTDSITLSESNTAEISQEDTSDEILPLGIQLDDSEASGEESLEKKRFIQDGKELHYTPEDCGTESGESDLLEYGAPEVNSLNISYVSIGSSFASEMQAVLSQFAGESQDENTPGWNPMIALKNPENISQDNDSSGRRKMNCTVESVDLIPRKSPSSEVQKSDVHPETTASNISSSDSIDPSDIWEHQLPCSHRSRPESVVRISESHTESKDSSCENVPPGEENYLHIANTETCV